MTQKTFKPRNSGSDALIPLSPGSFCTQSSPLPPPPPISALVPVDEPSELPVEAGLSHAILDELPVVSWRRKSVISSGFALQPEVQNSLRRTREFAEEGTIGTEVFSTVMDTDESSCPCNMALSPALPALAGTPALSPALTPAAAAPAASAASPAVRTSAVSIPSLQIPSIDLPTVPPLPAAAPVSATSLVAASSQVQEPPTPTTDTPFTLRMMAEISRFRSLELQDPDLAERLRRGEAVSPADLAPAPAASPRSRQQHRAARARRARRVRVRAQHKGGILRRSIEARFGIAVSQYWQFFLYVVLVLGLTVCLPLAVAVLWPGASVKGEELVLHWPSIKNIMSLYSGEFLEGSYFLTASLPPTAALAQTHMFEKARNLTFFGATSYNFTYALPLTYLALLMVSTLVVVVGLKKVSLTAASSSSIISMSTSSLPRYATAIFTSWDWAIRRVTSAELSSTAITKQLADMAIYDRNVATVRVDSAKVKRSQRIRQWTSYVITAVLIVGFAILILWLGSGKNFTNAPWLASFGTAALNGCVPTIASLLVSYVEKHNSLDEIVQAQTMRMFMLKYFNLFVNLFFLANSLSKVTEPDVTSRMAVYGEQIWSLIISDLVITFILIPVKAVFWRIIFKSRPSFPVSTAYVSTLYHCLLTWTGFFVLPGMAILLMIVLLLYFGMQMFNLYVICQPEFAGYSGRGAAVRAHQLLAATLVASWILFLIEILTVIPVGPAAGRTIYSVFLELLRRVHIVFSPLTLADMVDFIVSVPILAGITVSLSLVLSARTSSLARSKQAGRLVVHDAGRLRAELFRTSARLAETRTKAAVHWEANNQQYKGLLDRYDLLREKTAAKEADAAQLRRVLDQYLSNPAIPARARAALRASIDLQAAASARGNDNDLVESPRIGGKHSIYDEQPENTYSENGISSTSSSCPPDSPFAHTRGVSSMTTVNGHARGATADLLEPAPGLWVRKASLPARSPELDAAAVLERQLRESRSRADEIERRRRSSVSAASEQASTVARGGWGSRQ